MRTLFTTLVSAALLSACTQVNLLNEDQFFKRVSTGFGIWQVESVEDMYFNAAGSLDSTNFQTPDDAYYQFYLRTQKLSISFIDNPYMAVYFGTPESFTRFEYLIDDATNDRLSVYNYYTYTILDEKSNSFMLQRIEVDYATGNYIVRQVQLSRCGSCKPWFDTSVQQLGG